MENERKKEFEEFLELVAKTQQSAVGVVDEQLETDNTAAELHTTDRLQTQLQRRAMFRTFARWYLGCQLAGS